MVFKPERELHAPWNPFAQKDERSFSLRSFVPVRTDSGVKEVGPINDRLVGPLSDRLTPRGGGGTANALLKDLATQPRSSCTWDEKSSNPDFTVKRKFW